MSSTESGVDRRYAQGYTESSKVKVDEVSRPFLSFSATSMGSLNIFEVWENSIDCFPKKSA